MPRKLDLENVKPGSQIVYDRLIRGRPERELALEEARADGEIADLIYQLRTQAGLSQAELAQRVGTTQSAISRVEDANYDGHSLGLLRRIAAALGKEVVIQFVDRPAVEPAVPATV